MYCPASKTWFKSPPKDIQMKDILKCLENLGAQPFRRYVVCSGAAPGVVDWRSAPKWSYSYRRLCGFRDIEQKLSTRREHYLTTTWPLFRKASRLLQLASWSRTSGLTGTNQVSEILSGFNHRGEPSIQKEATILDFLGHRTGLSSYQKRSLGSRWKQSTTSTWRPQSNNVVLDVVLGGSPSSSIHMALQ